MPLLCISSWAPLLWSWFGASLRRTTSRCTPSWVRGGLLAQGLHAHQACWYGRNHYAAQCFHAATWHDVHTMPASTNCLFSNTHVAACCAGTLCCFQQVAWFFSGAKDTPLPTPTLAVVWVASLAAWSAVLLVFRAIAAQGAAAHSSGTAQLLHVMIFGLAFVAFGVAASVPVSFAAVGILHLLFLACPGPAPSPSSLFTRARLPVYVLLLALCWEPWSQVAWLTRQALKEAHWGDSALQLLQRNPLQHAFAGSWWPLRLLRTGLHGIMSLVGYSVSCIHSWLGCLPSRQADTPTASCMHVTPDSPLTRSYI